MQKKSKEVKLSSFSTILFILWKKETQRKTNKLFNVCISLSSSSGLLRVLPHSFESANSHEISSFCILCFVYVNILLIPHLSQYFMFLTFVSSSVSELQASNFILSNFLRFTSPSCFLNVVFCPQFCLHLNNCAIW